MNLYYLMLTRFIHRKNNVKMIKHFGTSSKPPNPNNEDFGPLILNSIMYLGFDLTQKFLEYKKNIIKK